MKKIYLIYLFAGAICLIPKHTTAQCGIGIDPGENVYLCSTPQTIDLIADISGPNIGLAWTNLAGTVLTNYYINNVNVVQTTSYVVEVKCLDYANNAIQNGDFESGNSGFYSDLTYNPGDLTIPGTYDVLTNPLLSNPGFAPCTDHTSGAGNMMAMNGPALPGYDLWCQTVQVTPFTEYYFSFWATPITSENAGGINFLINSEVLASIPKLHVPCSWKNRSGIWISGAATTAEVCIAKSSSLVQYAALDDIALVPVHRIKDTVTVHVVDIVAKATPPTSYIDCEGATLTLSGIGSTVHPQVTYNWSTPDGNIVSGQNTLNPVVNAAGTYTLTVSLNGSIGDCTKTATVKVVSLNQPHASITAPVSAPCLGTVQLNGSSSQPAQSSFQWTVIDGGNIVSGANSATALVDQSGTYGLLVTNTNTGCTAEATVTLIDPPLPIASASATAIGCSHPLSTLSGTGSSFGLGYTYNWSTTDGNIVSGQNNINATADTVGTYMLQVTNTLNLCTATFTVTVTSDTTTLPVQILAADTLNCNQTNITLAVDSTTYGVNNVYTWTALSGGNIVSGADSLSPVVNAPGLYALLVSDTLQACTGTDTIAVMADTSALTAIANAPDVLTCTFAEVMLNTNGSSIDSLLTYAWSTTDGNIVSGADSPAPLVNAPGIYHLLLTNPANGCTATDVAEVIADVSAPLLSILPPGMINCVQDTVALHVDNSAILPNYIYDWTALSGGNIVSGADSPTLLVDAPGAYQLLLTNPANGCTATDVAEVLEDVAEPAVALNVSDVLNCHNTTVTLENTGTNGSTPLSHVWTLPDGTMETTGATTNLNVNEPGNYTLLVTNTQNGCTTTAIADVVQYDPVTAALVSQLDATCFGAADGAISTTALGGDGLLAYLWNNDATTQNLEDIPAGTYSLTVTDGENCTAELVVTVGQPAELLANATSTAVSTVGASDGTASADPQGGTMPYAYHWSNDAVTATITDLPAGFYSVTVTDANGCSAVQTVEVFGGLCALEADVETIDAPCPGTAGGQATATPIGGTGPFEYTWTSGSMEQTATGLAAGAYSVTITDANGCTATATAQINATDLEAPVIQVASSTVVLGTTGAVSLSLQTLGAIVSDNCALESVQIVPDKFDCFDLGEQMVSITAQDASGNATTQSITVTIVDAEAPVLQCPASVMRCNTDNLVEHPAPVAFDNCLILGGTFSQPSGLPSGSVFPEGTTVNTYTFTDQQGNAGSCSFEVTILSPLTVSLDTLIHDIDNQQVGSIQVTVGGSMPGYTYNWLLNGDVVGNTEDLGGLGQGFYSLLVTDAFGCTTQAGPYELSSLVNTQNQHVIDLIDVFPNPSTGLVFVVLPEALLDEELHLQAYDATGRRVWEQYAQRQKRLTIDLNNVAGGIYAIRISTKQGQILRPVIVAR